MPTIGSVKNDIVALGTAGQEEILHYLEEIFGLGSFDTEVTNEPKENRFSRGKICPHCGHDEVSRNGKYNGKQIYICKSCRKTFTDVILSTKHNSKKDVKQWIQYAKCIIDDYSIRKCTEEVKISIPTSFYWMHKILDKIRAFMGIGSVGGVIEVDEAFFMESFKGNHKKSIVFTIPKKSP